MQSDPKTPIDDHPELDPAEGSREVIEKELAEQEDKDDKADGASDGAKSASH